MFFNHKNKIFNIQTHICKRSLKKVQISLWGECTYYVYTSFSHITQYFKGGALTRVRLGISAYWIEEMGNSFHCYSYASEVKLIRWGSTGYSPAYLILTCQLNYLVTHQSPLQFFSQSLRCSNFFGSNCFLHITYLYFIEYCDWRCFLFIWFRFNWITLYVRFTFSWIRVRIAIGMELSNHWIWILIKNNAYPHRDLRASVAEDTNKK